MPRALRIHVPGGFYHVTLRGNHRQPIFYCAADRSLLNTIVEEAVALGGARVHAYCWMPNHIHLLVEVSAVPLGRIILHIASRYARRVQAAMATTGHLFERRFHAVLVDADEYLLELVRYIHLNPVRGGIVKHPGDYAWSGHHAYLGRAAPPWMTTERVLRMFNARAGAAVAAYTRFVSPGAGARWGVGVLKPNPDDHRILGDDKFAATAHGPTWHPRSRQTLDELVEEGCRYFATTVTALASPHRDRRLTAVRAWIAHRAVAEQIASVSAVARRFNRNESAIRQAMSRYAPRDA